VVETTNYIDRSSKDRVVGPLATGAPNFMAAINLGDHWDDPPSGHNAKIGWNTNPMETNNFSVRLSLGIGRKKS